MESISKNSTQSLHSISLKIVFNNQTKRVGNPPKTLSELKETTKHIFKTEGLNQILSDFNFYTANKTFINTEEDYINILNQNELNQSNFKLFINSNCVSICESNVTQQSQFEKRNVNIDDKIKNIVETKFTKFEENMNKIFESFSCYDCNSIVPNEKLILNSDSPFLIQCDICLKYPIFNIKYICLICDDVNICENCEKSHNHPVVKFKSSDFSSNEDIINLVISNNKISNIANTKKSLKDIFLTKGDFLSNLKNKFVNMNKFKVEISMNSINYTIEPNSFCIIPIEISNESLTTLSADTLIYIKNTRDLFFSMPKVGKLFSPGEKLNIELECRTGSSISEYILEAHVYQKESKIDYTPLEFKVKICHFENNQFNISGFNPEDTVSVLPLHKKEILAEIIRKDLSSKDIKEICIILDKYDWKLNEEVIKEIK